MNASQFFLFATLLLLAFSDFTESQCYQEVGDDCGSDFSRKELDSDDIEFILKWHNDIRQKAASGMENGSIGTLDSASNMMKMMWDPELAELAQKLADQCVFSHDSRECRKVEGDRFMVGQNIAIMYFFGSSPQEVIWEKIIDGWYNGEVELFKKTWVDRYVFGEWGHYSQVIWWNSRSIGCGASFYKQNKLTYHLVACNYGATGNYIGTKVYKEGEPCSECPEETTCDSTYDALCAPEDPDDFEVTDQLPSDTMILF